MGQCIVQVSSVGGIALNREHLPSEGTRTTVRFQSEKWCLCGEERTPVPKPPIEESFEFFRYALTNYLGLTEYTIVIGRLVIPVFYSLRHNRLRNVFC